MFVTLPHLSQTHLQLLERCPRQFQQTYLEQLQAPLPPEQQARLTWGSQFHTLMQQYDLGLPLARSPHPSEQPLYEAMEGLLAQAGDLFGPRSPDCLRQSEHERVLTWLGYRLVVVYDLVLLAPQQGQIIDWKTYPQPIQRDRLAQHWQTRLYPFVLAETSDIPPEQITMTYWFTQGSATGSPPASYTFPYDRDRHEQTRRDLTQRLTQLTAWLTAYDQGQSLPQVPPQSAHCTTCEYAHRCDRLGDPTTTTPPLTPTSLTWADIAEIPL